jgi:hypothetical protein
MQTSRPSREWFNPVVCHMIRGWYREESRGQCEHEMAGLCLLGRLSMSLGTSSN